MLQHVVKVQKLNLVFSSVNLLIAVLEVALDNESRRVSSLGSRCMIRAGVSTLCLDVWNLRIVSVLLH